MSPNLPTTLLFKGSTLFCFKKPLIFPTARRREGEKMAREGRREDRRLVLRGGREKRERRGEGRERGREGYGKGRRDGLAPKLYFK